MAFRQKFADVLFLEPDILVIPESESPEYLAEKGGNLLWQNHLWIGDNRTKGLSVYARDGLGLRLKDTYDPSFRFFMPVEVAGPEECFDLYAVWTQQEKSASKSYVAHSLNALEHYGQDLTPASVLVGDFNSSAVFKQHGKLHMDLVEKLAGLGFSSLYHRLGNHVQGAEPDPTFFLHRNRNKPYHLDYVFCHDSRQVNEAGFSVGSHDDWAGLSDHVPLLAEF